jgi:DnaJ like chaperone protein
VAYKGKLIGALLGALAGPMGSILGGLLGHLYDRATEEAEGQSPRRSAPAGSPETDTITGGQLSFLASLIGLSIAVASADGRVRVSEVAALKVFFRENFPYGEDDQQVLARMIDETFLARERLEVDELCRHFRAASSAYGRRLLVRLLLRIGSADTAGLLPAEERLIRRIAGQLGLGPVEYDSLAAEFMPQGGWEFRVLGVEPSASDEEVRSAYRRLAAENHPDRVSSLGEEFVRVAEEKFKAVQEAYDRIRQSRGG